MKKTVLTGFIVLLITSALNAQPKLGSQAPDIILPDANGVVTKLSSLRGKVVLLDFWASWCGPCRMSNRKIAPVYEANKSKGFEIFGVSLDANKSSWLEAMKQDKISWTSLIDTKAANGNLLTQTWNLYYIPSTFLIDKDGKIVAINPEKSDVQKLLKKML